MGMFEQWGYRAALYLSALIAILHWSFLIYAKLFMPQLNLVPVHEVASVLVLVGLWLLSRMARYVGAAYYFLTTGTAVYALVQLSKPVVNVTVVWGVATGILCLAAALILLLSKRFAREFGAERENRPAYKKHLLHAYTALIVLVAIAGAVVDIVDFVSR
jgi:hypothetical protein